MSRLFRRKKDVDVTQPPVSVCEDVDGLLQQYREVVRVWLDVQKLFHTLEEDDVRYQEAKEATDTMYAQYLVVKSKLASLGYDGQGNALYVPLNRAREYIRDNGLS